MEDFLCLNPRFSTTRRLTRNTLFEPSKLDNLGNLDLEGYAKNSGIPNGGLRTEGYFKVANYLNTNVDHRDSDPLITVVTVVFNAVELLEETILSVLNQNYENLEYIVIDGGSTDGTTEIISKYESQIDYWISAADAGIYDAMNRGISVASGDWLNFMNAGDLFYSESTLTQIFSSGQDVGKILYGDVHIRYENLSRVEEAGEPRNLWRGMQFCHQSIFCDAVFHKKNPFNIDNKICADLEFCYSAYKRGLKFTKLSEIVSSVSVGGVSQVNLLKTLKMANTAVRDSGASPLVDIYFFLKSIDVQLRGFLKRVLPNWLVNKLISIK